MGRHNVIIVDFNNLFTGHKNFLRDRLDGSRRLEYAFGGLASLRTEVPGLTIIPIWDFMRGRRNQDLVDLPIEDQRKLYMVPESLDGWVKADHFVVKVANQLDAFILSRDAFSAEQGEGYAVNSSAIVAPIFLEKEERWLFVMKDEYRALLRSAEYRDLVTHSSVRIDSGESFAAEDVLVRALKSEYSKSFVQMLEKLPKFRDVASPVSFDTEFDRDVREMVFNIHIPVIEAEFKEKFLIVESLRQHPFKELVELFQTKRDLVHVDPSDGVRRPKVDDRVEPHFNFFGEEISELATKLDRRVTVTAFLRRLGGTLSLTWLDPKSNVKLSNVDFFPDEILPMFVELRGRVREIDGEISIEVDNPIQYRRISFEDVLASNLPTRAPKPKRSTWVLPRFPWSGNFGATVNTVEDKKRKNWEGATGNEEPTDIQVDNNDDASTFKDGDKNGVGRSLRRRLMPVLILGSLGLAALITIVLK
ncbi:MAG: hypothetical protein EBX92_07895 [Actinobacteria bacterium]|nr:hypothetical protein [Actinomycetota bacterium]